ncbi:MAG: STAS domain-containing protein, partial [Myxococcales bacterium]
CTGLKYIDAALLQVIAALRLEAQHCGAVFNVQHVPEAILRDARLLGMSGILLDESTGFAPPRA